jgi:NADPH:quinone reductase-like Zn-dependent oxidoreductase
MKAYRFEAFDSLDDLRLRDEEAPRPQRGELLIRVRAVSLNSRDLAMLRGRNAYPFKTGLIPVSDAAGEVVEIGADVRAFKVGDRVIGIFHPRWFGGRMPTTFANDDYGSEQDGWLVELKAVNQEAVVLIPDSLSYEQAATLPCAALTAWSALGGSTPVRAGQSVLIQGTGGVSIFALQFATAFGCTVIATTSNSAKAERLRALGADAVVNYLDVPAWGERVCVLTNGRGVDRVVEVGGPGTIEQSLRAVAYGGEIASMGYLSNDNPSLDFFKLKHSGAVFRNIMVGDRAGLEDLTRTVEMAKIQPVIDRVFEFEAARDALAYLRTGQHVGKVVICFPL